MKFFYTCCCLVFFYSCIQRQPEPVTVVAPTSVSTKIEAADSTYLRIWLKPGMYEISLLDKTLSTNNVDSVDRFIIDHKAVLNSDRILLFNNGSTDSSFKKIIAILKKESITKFKLISL